MSLDFDNQLYGSKAEEMKIIKAWKSKSLNSKFMERYKLPLYAPDQTRDLDKEKLVKNSKKTGNKNQQVNTQVKSDLLPEPKFVKISEQIFCVYVNNSLAVFKLFNSAERQQYKPKEQIDKQKTFYSKNMFFQNNIKFVVGNNSEYIFIGLQNQLHIHKIEYKQQKDEDNKISRNFKGIYEYDKKVIPKIKGVSFVQQPRNGIDVSVLIAITDQKIIKYRIEGTKQEIREPMEQIRIILENKKDQLVYADIKTIQILCENNSILYLFGTMEGIQREMNEKIQGGKDKKCEFLYLIKFNLDNKGQSIKLNMSMIDHVFETGIFSKSKVFQAGASVFLISLFQEIIVVKYHFEKYVVWDNISLAPSKSSEKKGQLVLADKIVMVYTEAGEIYAHNIYFCWDQYKLKYPRIDNFKGTINEDEILYDALVLEFEKGSFMKVLFYFKQHEVYTPNNKFAQHKQDKGQGEHRELNMYIRCIQQNAPVIKLQQLFKSKKTPQEISEFVQRFNIAEIQKSKCQWSVSDKTEKDIENLLLEIKDNEYIQNQLTTILKSKPHDLKFLSRIEKKQVERYKRMLATKLLKNDQDADPERLSQLYQTTGSYFTKEEVAYIKKIIQWVMESIMFEKKLLYSKNFLEFMEYDFIDIGKLKAASLKQQIKLLSCKGFDKRLQYFLNSFKYMILENFEDIFEFLIENKSEAEVEKFFKDDFPFILPKFVEDSEIFFYKKNQRARKQSFGPQPIKKLGEPLYKPSGKSKKFIDSQQKCLLWQPKKTNKDNNKDNKNNNYIDNNNNNDNSNDNNNTNNNGNNNNNNNNGNNKSGQNIGTMTEFIKQIETEIQLATNAYKTARQRQKQKSRSYVLKQCLKIQQATKEFHKILNQFVKQDWFINNKSKQHSIIEVEEAALQSKMNYLTRIGVFHLLIKFFYNKIAKQVYSLQKVDKILESFKNAGLIPQSFQQNILARRQIYKRISKVKRSDVALPLLQNFLILEETDYFDYIFLNYREMLLKQIKQVYDAIIPGLFKQKFSIYLNSDKIQLTQIIKFLQFFQGNQNVDIRLNIFTCIKNLLKVSDKSNTAFFVDKLMELQVLKKQGNSHSGIDSLIDEAKIAFGYYFYNFFAIFEINQTYKQLINQTLVPSYEDCKIIKTILEKYCHYEFKQIQPNSLDEEQHRGAIRFEPCFSLQEIQCSITKEPLQFWGIILYLIDTLRFQVPSEIVFDRFIQLELQVQNYDDIVTFMTEYEDIFGVDLGSSQNSRVEADQYQARNFILLKYFYHESNFTVRDRLMDNILIWTRKQYKALFQYFKPSFPQTFIQKQYNSTFQKISNMFQYVVQQLHLENAEIIREKAFLSMIKNIKQISPLLVHYILALRFENFIGNYLVQNSALLNTVPSFIFMMRLLNEIPKAKFDQKQEKIIMNQIYLMDCIYELFKSASKYNENDSSIQSQDKEEPALTRFFMQLAMRLIKDNQFTYSRIIIAKKCHFKDIFYQFLSLIQQVQRKPTERQFKKFIQDFIQVTHEKNVSKMFQSFITQNRIQKFYGKTKEDQDNKQTTQSARFNQQKNMLGSSKDFAPAQRRSSFVANFNFDGNKQKNNGPLFRHSKQMREVKEIKDLSMEDKETDSNIFTIIIFECLIDSHRIDQSFYFLIRNQVLPIAQAVSIAFQNPQTSSHALICIYMRCLKNFLCQQFYPTYTFFKHKHQILLNQYQRKDIIKDINIAISRMKEMISQLKLNAGDYMKAFKIDKKFVQEFIDKKTLSIQDVSLAGISNQQKIGEENKKIQEQEKNQKLEQMNNKIKALQGGLQDLRSLYQRFMRQNDLDPLIKLNEEDIKQGKFKLDHMSRQITPDQLENINRSRALPSPKFDNQDNNKGFAASQLKGNILQEKNAERELENEKKKIKQNPQFIQLQQQINNQIKQTKLLGQKHQQFEIRIPKQSQGQAKHTKTYKQLKDKEKADIDSIKQSYKSQTAERVNQILEDIKLRKSKIYEKSDVKSKYSKISIEDSQGPRSRQNSFEVSNVKAKPNDILSKNDFHPRLQREMSNAQSNASYDQSKYEVHVHGIDGHNKNLYMPVTMTKQLKQQSRISINSKQKLSTLSQNQNKPALSIASNHHLSRSHVKSTLQDIIKLFSQKESQCVKYIQKLEIVKNNVQVGLQITKNVYSMIHQFENFVKFIAFVLENYPKYNEIIEQKAYKIVSQAMGIQYKINLKQLFPIQLFTTVIATSIKQYYKSAYQTIRPNLLRILSKPQTNIHGLAILFRFGFGSDNIYYYRVYEDYIRVILKEYSQSVGSVQEKKLFMLAEKLRTYYSNVNPQNRQSKFQGLLKEVKDQGKRKILVNQMLKVLQRRSQMLTGEKQSDLKEILIKIK